MAENNVEIVDTETGEIKSGSDLVGTEIMPVGDAPGGVYMPQYHGLASAPFSDAERGILLAEIDPADVEIRPDGIVYLPEIKYRRILNRAFGPGAWCMVPNEIRFSSDDNRIFYDGSLWVHGRFVARAIGEADYHPGNRGMSHATAAESAKSNCLMRCCKDLGIASELWDTGFIQRWQDEHAVRVWCVGVRGSKEDGKKRQFWRRRDRPAIGYPWQEDGGSTGGGSRATERRPARPTERKPAGNAPAKKSPPEKPTTTTGDAAADWESVVLPRDRGSIYEGRTLGEVMRTPGGPAYADYLATRYYPRRQRTEQEEQVYTALQRALEDGGEAEPPGHVPASNGNGDGLPF